MEIKKAKNQQQKLHRINSILEAAEALFQSSSNGELPSAIQIANQANVAKGTLYIYFSTKEAIFLTLLERHIQNWIADFATQLRLYEHNSVNDVCQYLSNYWQQNPVIGDLSRISDALLESRVEFKVYSSFQTKIANDFKRIVPSIKNLNQEVESSQWIELLKLSQSLLTLAWQKSQPRHDTLNMKKIDFADACEMLLLPFWQSLIELKTERPKEKSTWRKFLGS